MEEKENGGSETERGAIHSPRATHPSGERAALAGEHQQTPRRRARRDTGPLLWAVHSTAGSPHLLTLSAISGGRSTIIVCSTAATAAEWGSSARRPWVCSQALLTGLLRLGSEAAKVPMAKSLNGQERREHRREGRLKHKERLQVPSRSIPKNCGPTAEKWASGCLWTCEDCARTPNSQFGQGGGAGDK